ncbi:MAG: alkaline phosphatase family protein [Gemmatimonadota bacterium]|nr:alkaline phosphatase family protein [Gemmatimonadota bacterium]
MKRQLLSLLACGALAACTEAPTQRSVTDSPGALSYDRAVVVSLGGLRGDALAAMPELRSLLASAVWTDSMLTVVPSRKVPTQLALLSGRDVPALGITTDDVDAASRVMLDDGITTLFNWVHAAGPGITAAVASTSYLDPSIRASAQNILGIDTLNSTSLDGADVVTAAIELWGGAAAPKLLMVHLADADLAGHDDGWISSDTLADNVADVLTPAYLRAALHVDSALARLHAALSPSIAAGTTALIIVGDHGGGHGIGCESGVSAAKNHCASYSGDVLVPFVLLGKGLAPGRLARGARLTQVAATAAKLLGVAPSTSAEAAIAY